MNKFLSSFNKVVSNRIGQIKFERVGLIQFTHFNFARNIGRKSKEADEQDKLNTTVLKENIKPIKQEEIALQNKILTEPEGEKLDINQLDRMVYSLYQKSKYHVLDANRRPLEQHERHFQYYKFIIQHIRILNPENFAKFIRAICYFKHKDDKTIDILSYYLHSSKNKFANASLVLYALSTLNIDNESFKQQCLKIIESTDFSNENKSTIIPMIYSLTEWNLYNDSLNSKVDEFVRINQKEFNEHVYKYLYRKFVYSSAITPEAIIIISKSLNF
jgi:hypothetical protein